MQTVVTLVVLLYLYSCQQPSEIISAAKATDFEQNMQYTVHNLKVRPHSSILNLFLDCKLKLPFWTEVSNSESSRNIDVLWLLCDVKIKALGYYGETMNWQIE